MVILFNTASYNYYDSLGVSISRWFRWGEIPNHTECKFSFLIFLSSLVISKEETRFSLGETILIEYSVSINSKGQTFSDYNFSNRFFLLNTEQKNKSHPCNSKWQQTQSVKTSEALFCKQDAHRDGYN